MTQIHRLPDHPDARPSRHVLRPRHGLALAALACSLLAGCSVLPKPAPVEVFLLPSTLPASTTPPTGAALPVPLPASLRVTRPAASNLLAGQRMLVQPEGDRVSYYKGAQWSEPAPQLLRNRLLDALRGDGRIATLSSDDRILQADFELDGDLRAFQGVYRDGQVQVLLRLDLRLVRPATQRIIASRRFELSQPAAERDLPAVVRAFGDASDRQALQVVDWTVEQMLSASRQGQPTSAPALAVQRK